jgi:hypothetical protein
MHPMRALAEVLPELVSDLEGALLPLGRGDLARQLATTSPTPPTSSSAPRRST